MSRVMVALGLMLPACGQKGPPLAPLHLVPAAATEVAARRIGDQVRVRFVLPNKNVNGPGPVELDRVEIYALTVPPGLIPTNRVLLAKENVVGQIEVRPPLAEGEEPKEGDTRPSPGTAVFFDEALTAAKLEPIVPKTPEPPAAKPPASTAAAPAPTPTSSDPARVYIVRGVTKSGRTGAQSTRVQVPLVALPNPPVDLKPRVTETAVVLEWKPPPDAGTAPLFNVYRAEELMQPVNATPLDRPSFEYADAKFGQEYCFRVRSVIGSAGSRIEGEPSEPTCVTPQDVFPPAAPKRPDAVATAGQISLIWDANTEKDIAGYLVFRGEMPDGPLQSLTPTPIRETSFRDTTVQPNVRYVYAIVAVDTATPPNTSAQSPRVEETAR